MNLVLTSCPATRSTQDWKLPELVYSAHSPHHEACFPPLACAVLGQLPACLSAVSCTACSQTLRSAAVLPFLFLYSQTLSMCLKTSLFAAMIWLQCTVFLGGPGCLSAFPPLLQGPSVHYPVFLICSVPPPTRGRALGSRAA